MKKYILATLLLLFAFNLSTKANVEPKDAYKAVLNLFTYDSNGKLLHSGTAFFVDGQANAVTSYDLMKDAAKAEVVDCKGKKYEVYRILGANATTNLVKFSVQGVKKHDFFAIAEKPVAAQSTLFLMQYTNNKKKQPQSITVTRDEAYNDYRYYHISATNDKANMACPLMNAQGELTAIVQFNVEKDAKVACAIDARFIHELTINSTSSLNSDLRDLQICKALPDNSKDALTYIYMLPTSDTLVYKTALNDFIAGYPYMADGYMNRAAYWAAQNSYAACEADFKTALEKSQTDTTGMKSDAVLYNVSDLVYRVALQQKDSVPVYPNWTLARAEAAADSAYALNKNTLYLLQKGKCQFAQKNYAGAYQTFLTTTADRKFASPEVFFSAVRALELSGNDSLQVLALMDSCINHLPQPVNMKNAQYYLERSQRLIRVGKYREAVLDYNQYEQIVGPRNLNGQFYYLREQAEMQARMYQQALDDIRTAIAISQDKLFYRLEEALILLRVGEFPQAIDYATQLLKDLPENPDCYKIIGISYGELKNYKKAQENLQRAKSLGDTTVEPFLQKYK